MERRHSRSKSGLPRSNQNKGRHWTALTRAVFIAVLSTLLPAANSAALDYRDALIKSTLFYEAQRSGALPANQQVTWRQNSALTDSAISNVNLSGGYYDAGDNVKFGFPLAFTVTMLSWSVWEYRGSLALAGELGHAQEAIRWGTDYLLKACTGPTELWAQVGDPGSDHSCWERPEDMDTPRTAYKVDAQHPGSDIAAETAAALAAAAIVFQTNDTAYSMRLLSTAKQLFTFADKYRGKYSDSLSSVVCPFYCSYSGYQDELLWGATWLYKASKDSQYLQYIVDNGASLGGLGVTTTSLNWDNKYAGAQILLSQIFLGGTCGITEQLAAYKQQADKFVCATLPGLSSSQTNVTKGGLLYYQGGSNLQYVATSAFLLETYGRFLSGSTRELYCHNVPVDPSRLSALAKQQVDYILGNNPLKISYMVGFGTNYPLRVHHRAASLPSKPLQPGLISCAEGWSWYSSSNANPNVLSGAIVGGPDAADGFSDVRSNYQQLEPAIYINAPLIGLLALFATNATQA